MIRRLILRWQLERGYRRQAIIRKARAEAARKGHVASRRRAYENDSLRREMAR